LKLIWSRSALADKHAVWLYLADRSVELADSLEARIDSRVASLSRFPWQGRPTPGSDLRELSIPDTQHVVVYRVAGDIVRIMRIWSTAQDR
jgi:toxin ParE1/3/4